MQITKAGQTRELPGEGVRWERTDGSKITLPSDEANRLALCVEDGWAEYNAPIPTPEEIAFEEALRIEGNIDQLWSAADAYVHRDISGAAFAMLSTLVTLHRISAAVCPKGIAVRDWIDSVWSLYYTRKATLISGGVLTQEMLDFSSAGPMPYTVPDLKVELISAGA